MAHVLPLCIIHLLLLVGVDNPQCGGIWAGLWTEKIETLLLEGEKPMGRKVCINQCALVIHYRPSLGISYGRAGCPLGGGM